MPISGVVITCRPEASRELCRQLDQQGVVEVTHTLEDGSLVAVIESSSVDDEVSVVKSILATAGVLDVRIAYHNFEDIADKA